MLLDSSHRLRAQRLALACVFAFAAGCQTASVGSPTALAQPRTAAAPQALLCQGTPIAIGAVQSAGPVASATYSGTQVTLRGVVVGAFEGPAPALRGFYLQDGGDNDPATSDGIFVFNGNAISVTLGDDLQVKGVVGEFGGQTQLNSPVIEKCGSAALPPPTPINLPVAAAVGGLPFLERFEGMRVTFPQTLTVSENFNLARFGELTLSSDGRLRTPTNSVDPSDDPASGTTSSGGSNVAAVTAAQDQNNRRSILLDDASSAQNPLNTPYLNAQQTRRVGDSLAAGFTAVLGYGFGSYRLQPTSAPVFLDSNPRPSSPPSLGVGNLRVSSFNVLNYFNVVDAAGNVCFPASNNSQCRGADSAQEFARQRAKIFSALRGLDADIVGLTEIQNNGDAADSAIFDLVTGLNASLPAGSLPYTYTRDPIGYGPDANKDGVVTSADVAARYPGGDDAIKVAFIYRPDVVTPVGDPVASDSSAFENARAPIAQTFSLNSNDATITAIINHFKSKTPASPSLPASDPNADQGDGQGEFTNSRRLQAQALLGFIAARSAAAGDPDVIAFGDFNAYNQEDPLDILRAGGLVKLADSASEYSFVFDAQSGALDHAFVTLSLASQVTGAADWHINADEPRFLDYNQEFKDNPSTPAVEGSTDYFTSTTPFRASDHDPLLVGLSLRLHSCLPILLRQQPE